MRIQITPKMEMPPTEPETQKKLINYHINNYEATSEYLIMKIV